MIRPTYHVEYRNSDNRWQGSDEAQADHARNTGMEAFTARQAVECFDWMEEMAPGRHRVIERRDGVCHPTFLEAVRLDSERRALAH